MPNFLASPAYTRPLALKRTPQKTWRMYTQKSIIKYFAVAVLHHLHHKRREPERDSHGDETAISS